ncbi:MAG: hypothetical protein K8953_00955, partial [Proteobacteria bacterium]|nr:hypothetical protein [Pseudomonadota bacterium]
ANDLCTGDNVGIICGTDPFNAICFTGNTYFSARVNNCITAGNANSNNNCNTVFTESASNTCLTNPFTDACTSDADFGTYATTARTNRVTFCGTNSSDTICDTLTACQNNPFATECEAYFQTERDNREGFCDMAGNVGNALCMGASRMGVCGIDPFNTSCLTDKTYLPVRLGECIKAENAEDMRCNSLLSDSTMNTTITACLTNPFSDACAMNSDFTTYADDARTNRESFCGMMGNESKAPCTALTACQGNPFGTGCGAYFESAKIPHCAIRGNAGGDCATTLSRPNAATWAHSFATELSATPTTGTGFLQGTATGISTGDATNIASENNITLNLETATYNNVPLGGDAEDGFAYFTGNSDSGSYHYAGIFSGTNLGAPITGTSGDTATWNGRISARGTFSMDRDFTLTITFGASGGTLTSLAPASNSASSDTRYKIDATFNDKGVIIATEGNIILDEFGDNPTFSSTPMMSADRASGTLTGLIGQEGAVGVFMLEPFTGSSFYVGGFVAAPPVPAAPPPPNPCIAAGDCVDTAAWLAGVTPTPPDLPETPRKNQFLKGTSTGFADRANLNIRDV